MPIEEIFTLNKIHPKVGGLYVIASPEMQEAGLTKVGMSQTNIYKRLNSYINYMPLGFTIFALFLMPNGSKSDREKIRKAEQYTHKLLQPAKIELENMRLFETRIEIFKNPVDQIIKALEKTQTKFQAVWFNSEYNGKIDFDTKLHEVKKIIKEDKDEHGPWYYVLWGDGQKTWERESTLKGRDGKGDWIVDAFKKYLNNSQPEI